MARVKNSHKNHNTGRHRSKRAIKRSTEGKVNNVKTLTKKNKLIANKDQRRNQSVQQRLKKREEVLMEKRKFGGESSAPILIAIVPLQDDVDLQTLLLTINRLEETNQAVIKENSQGITHISIPRLKKRFALVVPSKNNVLEALDVMKVASTVLFIIKDNIDEWGEEILKTSIPQKLPTTMVVFADKTDFSMTKNKTKKLRQQTTKLVEKYLPDAKTHSLNNAMDAYNLLRVLGEQEQQSIFYRKHRAHLMAENIKYCPENDENGTLKITGYLRGATLSVNGLVHVIGFGDFQMSQIDLPTDPYCSGTKGNMETDEVKVLERADPEKQESLEAENTPDPMDAEQTWPTAEELEEAKREQMEKKNTKRVPKGTSNYQAAWIIDDENDEVGDGDENYEDEDEVEGEDGGEKMTVDKDDWDGDASQADEEYETMTVSEAPIDEQKYDEDMDLMEERQAMVRFKEAKEDAQFPDEVDTPQDIPARERFQKYRGLESFRTSPWDPKEDLPFDFGRIFQFKNFQRSTKLVFKENEVLIGAEPGSYITIHIKDVPKKLYDAYSTDGQRQLIVFGLLPNEHKMSLLNVVLKRTTDPEAQPIASKEKLIFQCGFRRFVAAPIFSEHTYTPKHKYLRFFQPGETAVASMFAPITFPQCPVLCFQQKKNELPKLVATGSILSANPDRLVIKRAVLSGHPFKVFKRSAVIRFMFYNREDIDWFKPVKLRTKYGRRGHIKEPLGTHGHMKCVFDGQLKSQDTILMNLFKRVYPKWTYEPCLYSTDD